MAINREFKESPIRQGEDEQIAYQLTTTPWGSTPTAAVCKLFDAAGTDVTSTNMTSGTGTINGDVITTGTVKSLTDGGRYKLQIKFTSGGNIFEAFGFIEAEE